VLELALKGVELEVLVEQLEVARDRWLAWVEGGVRTEHSDGLDIMKFL
jgi:hypothetical protein